MTLFGTSGIRRIVDSWLLQVALKVGLAVGLQSDGIVIGCDTRTSSYAMKKAVIAGVLSAGCECYDAGVVPTPTIALAARNYNAGIMITASHNPPQYNGIKLINPDGTAFDEKQQKIIEEVVSDNHIKTAAWQQVKTAKKYPDAIKKHIERVLTFIPQKYRLNVVLDCGCGAGSVVTPRLLRLMGCNVIRLNCKPSGYFPRYVEPKEENLTNLINEVRKHNADLGIAHDGDADRMMAVDDKGRFVDGDKLQVILSRKLGVKRVVTTVDASMLVDEAGFEVIRTGVGDNNISRELKKSGDIGGEPSGSWVFPKNSLCPDGVYAAAMLVSIVSGVKLSKLVDGIYGYHIIRGNTSSKGIEISGLEEKLVSEIKPLSVSKVDGIKLFLKDAWLLVRASGTEPKIRITAEAKTQEQVKYLFNKSVELIDKSTHGNGGR